MKSLYALLQKNVLDRRRWRNQAELPYVIVLWDRAYLQPRAGVASNGLGKLTPSRFELAFAPKIDQAP